MWNSVTGLEYQNLDEEIKRTMKRSAGDVVRLGYLLRSMMDKKLWEEYYDCFDDYLRNELHMDYTMASRFIGINKKYSVDGGSENIDTKWEGYSQAVLIEMLSMPPELEEKVTPKMTVRQVREVKRQARKGVSQSGQEGFQTEQKTPKTEQETSKAKHRAFQTEQRNGVPETEIDTSQEADVFPNQVSVEEWFASMPEGFSGGGKDEVLDAEYRELDTAEEVATSQTPELVKPDEKQYQYLDAFAKHFISSELEWLLEDISNRVMDVCKSPQEIKKYLGKESRTWYFSLEKDKAAHINLFDNYVQLWDGKNNYLGDFDWFYLAAAIQRMWNDAAFERANGSVVTDAADEKEESDADGGEPGEDPVQFDELAEIKHILAKEQKTLDEYLAVGGLPVKLIFKQKTIVAALASMICDLEAVQFESEPQEDAVVQPELPVFRNNNQRKEWLRSYRDWGLWYRDGNIGVEYYKYDFDNGGRLIAEVYTNEATEYHDAYEYCRLHLVGGPKPQKGKYGIGKWAWHEKYSSYPNSETELVEFLKEVQKQES